MIGELSKEHMKAILKNVQEEKYVDAVIIGYLGEALLRCSAQKIYILNIAKGGLNKETFSALPEYLKSRIIWADQDKKIERTIIDMLLPIYEETKPNWEKIRKKAGVEAGDIRFGHEHGWCVLEEFLYTLTIASKFDTEADVDFELVLRAVKRLKNQVTSSESVALLSRIQGILNCYQIKRSIPGIMAAPQITSAELLRDLLDDARVVSLSKSRYLFGIPGSFEIAMIRVKQKIREIISDKRNRDRLLTASKVGNIATKPLPFQIPEIEIEAKKVFTPPLVSLHDKKPNCLKTGRWLPRTKPPKP